MSPTVGARLRASLARLSGRSQVAGYGYGGRTGSYSANLMQGGIVNPQTGMGTTLDKSEHSLWLPTRIYSKHVWEILRVQSWAARKFIEIPVDDMMAKRREWQGEDGDAAVEAMEKTEKTLMVFDTLRRAFKAGRLYGTALLCIMSREAPLEDPLVPERIRMGDVMSLRVFDRYSASVTAWEEDPMMPDYDKPMFYDIHPHRGRPFRIHHSRVLRFDGLTGLTDDGFITYDRDWGVSDLVPAMLAVMQDQTVATGVAHLTQVASVPVLHVEGLRETLAGSLDDEMSGEDIARQVNQLMSLYRILMLDKGSEEYERVAVNFGGLDGIIDRVERRLAAAADIPLTRFYGMSPAGLNATGDSDWRNYVTMLTAKREAMLPPILDRLDPVLARHAGLAEAPDHTWPDLLDMGQQAIALAAKTKAEALQIAVDGGWMTPNEARESLRGDVTYGPLPGAAPDVMPLDLGEATMNTPGLPQPGAGAAND